MAFDKNRKTKKVSGRCQSLATSHIIEDMLSQKINSSYVTGMIGFNDLFEMLFDSLLRSCRGITLSNMACFGWRGFRIDQYQDLARNQFTFQIETTHPKILTLKEAYHDVRYHYPWDEHPQFDLELNGFFEKTKKEQRELLVEFTFQAIEQANEWQRSDLRKTRIPAQYLDGRSASSYNLQVRAIYEQIPPETLQSVLIQNQIFLTLDEAIRGEVQARMDRKVELEPNTSWYNWDFRGLRMKICDPDGLTPPGPYQYFWRIYYRQPAIIRFETENWQWIMSLDDVEFVTLNLKQQTEWLILFVRQALDLVSPNPIEIF